MNEKNAKELIQGLTYQLWRKAPGFSRGECQLFVLVGLRKKVILFLWYDVSMEPIAKEVA